MLLILLMLIMLVAGLILWFVLVLRQIAILVVVAFAPLLIAGYLWAPTRSWVRRATEVLDRAGVHQDRDLRPLRHRPGTAVPWVRAVPERLRRRRWC